MQATLPRRDIVLLGAGHTNAHVLRMWKMHPLPDVRLTCVSNFLHATYSGMLPGTLAGQYPRERMEIDLVRFCAAAGIRLITGEVCGLDLDQRELLFADRSPVAFDALSLGIGSVPRGTAGMSDTGGIGDDPSVIPIKPMQTFLDRLDERLALLKATVSGRPVRVTIVGGGAGGIEITFCLPAHLRQQFATLPVEIALVDGEDRLLPSAPDGTGRRVTQELESRGVQLLLGRRVQRVKGGQLEFDDGSQHPADLVLWATTAAPPALLSKLNLPTDERGFLLTRPTLQTTADAPVFVVGDSGTIAGRPTPKAGVYAVRQGPILWENLSRLIAGRPLVEYQPQSGFLSALNTGDGRAIMSYKGRSFRGRWCWWLKDRIDGRFMDKHQDYRPMEMSAAPPPDAAPPEMRCAGCGGKVAGSVLSKVLARLDVPASPVVKLGLDAPDDAAVLSLPPGRAVAATVDFFHAFHDDAYLVGRVAALNAASDLFAMGARPHAALAMATLPVGPPRKQEQLLLELLAGSLHEFRKMGATLVGGHTVEGPQLAIGFTLLGDVAWGDNANSELAEEPAAEPNSAGLFTKTGLRPGDHLLLSKPLGSGVLLAAAMLARCRWPWMESLTKTLLQSNQQTADALGGHGLRALTDVTGFGLAGHLLEMLTASEMAAEVRLADLPLLPGALELASEGMASTLAPANRAAESEMETDQVLRRDPRYSLLFDPQTSGGLLWSVRPDEMAELQRVLEQQTGQRAWDIGNVRVLSNDQTRLRVV